MIPINQSSAPQRGFALLITLLTVAVVVSATLAIVELSRLQLKLSVDSRDAEIAFSAANAAKECGQYVRGVASTAIKNGSQLTFNCFGNSTAFANTGSTVLGGGGGTVRRYTAEIDWGTSPQQRCSVVDIIAVYAGATDVIVGGGGAASLKRQVSNYSEDSMTCKAGSECTIIAAAGYNAKCDSRNELGVLKR